MHPIPVREKTGRRSLSRVFADELRMLAEVINYNRY